MTHQMTRIAASALLGSAMVSGCAAPADSGDSIQALQVALDDTLSMAVQVDWATDQAGLSWVEYGTDTSYGSSTPVRQEEGGEHHATLLGLPPLSQVFYKVVHEVDGIQHEETGTIETGNIPADFPNLETTVFDAERLSPEPYLLGVATGMSGILFTIDREGQGRWYLQNDPTLVPTSDVLQSVTFTAQGDKVLYGAYSTNLGVVDAVLFTSTLDKSETEAIPAPNAHHEAISLPDGATSWLSYDIRPWSDGHMEWNVMGDAIVEMGPDGVQRTVFSTWDWRTPDVHSRWNQAQAGYADWTHANNLVYNAQNDTYLLSLGYVSTILEIDRLTGQVLREFGRYGMPVEAGSVPFNFQHAANWTDQGTLLMASYNGDLSEIFAVEYAITESNELKEVWSYGIGVGLRSFAGGQATRMDNGNTLFGAGTAGVIREITPDGAVVWETWSDMGQAFCKMTPFWDFYLGR